MSPKQLSMLKRAAAKSLPGDGLRIDGAGEHTTARALERRGYVRIASAYVGDIAWNIMSHHVFATAEGKAALRKGNDHG